MAQCIFWKSQTCQTHWFCHVSTHNSSPEVEHHTRVKLHLHRLSLRSIDTANAHGTHGTYLAKLSLSQAQPACAGRMGSNRWFKSFRPTSRTGFLDVVDLPQLCTINSWLSEPVWICLNLQSNHENIWKLFYSSRSWIPQFRPCTAECRTKECAPEAMAICGGHMLRLVFNMLLRHAISKEHAFCEVKDLSSIHERYVLNLVERCWIMLNVCFFEHKEETVSQIKALVQSITSKCAMFICFH
jgi:hypothetical protein